MWEWVATLLGIPRWVRYMVQFSMAVWAASLAFAAYQTCRASKARADQALHAPHLAQFTDKQPPPTRSEIVRATTHWMVPIIALGIVCATAAVLRVDFMEHQAERVEFYTAERALGTAEARQRCDNSKYRLPQCDAWETAARWTDSTIAMMASHNAWNETIHHLSHDMWEHVPIDWRVVYVILVVAAGYWLWTGPFSGALQFVNLIMAHKQHATQSVMYADQMQPLPTTGTIPFTPLL